MLHHDIVLNIATPYAYVVGLHISHKYGGLRVGTYVRTRIGYGSGVCDLL